MKVFNAIIGVFAVFGSLYCILWPGISFLNAGWIVAMLLFMWGVCSIISAIFLKQENKKDTGLAGSGFVGLLLGVAAAVISLLAMTVPSIELMFDMIIFWIFIFWLMFTGVFSIVKAVKHKNDDENSSRWIFSLVLGIIMILIALFCVCDWLLTAQIIGTLIGIGLLVSGIRLIFSAFEPSYE